MFKMIILLITLFLGKLGHSQGSDLEFNYHPEFGLCLNSSGEEGRNPTISTDALQNGESGECRTFENIHLWGNGEVIYDLNLSGAVFISSSIGLYEGMKNANLAGADLNGLMNSDHHNYAVIGGTADRFTKFPDLFCTLYEEHQLLQCN